MTEYSSLSKRKRAKLVEEVAEGECDNADRDVLVDRTKAEVEDGNFYPLGEPVSSVNCDQCGRTINLQSTCAAIKQFSCASDPKDGTIERTPELLCTQCGRNAEQLFGSNMVGVMVRGVLERRRTRPGDKSDAPYLLYVARTDSTNVKIVRPNSEQPTRRNWSTFTE